jgi:hypothetical protein
VRRIIVNQYTGGKAANLVIARRVARKIRGTVSTSQCVLIDCEDVTFTPHFLKILAAEARPEKTRFCGLSVADQTLIEQITTQRESQESVVG